MTKSKKPDFAKASFFGLAFFTPKIRFTFIGLMQVFTKKPIFYYLNLKHCIYIEIDASEYVDYIIINQMILVTAENLNFSNFSKIG